MQICRNKRFVNISWRLLSDELTVHLSTKMRKGYSEIRSPFISAARETQTSYNNSQTIYWTL
jgi:hypothetical protein